MWVQANTDYITKQLDYIMLNKFIFSGKTEELDETHKHACIHLLTVLLTCLMTI